MRDGKSPGEPPSVAGLLQILAGKENPMMKRILVPLDGSPLAERALAVAANLARSTDGALILVQALTLPIEYNSLLVPQLAPLDIEGKERIAQAYLTRQADLPILADLPVETQVRTEAPALAILNVAAESQANMIVMTSHGRSGFGRWVFGSVAEHVARHAEVPVLMLRQSQLPFWTDGAELVELPPTERQAGSLPLLRVLVPLDGSPLAETVLDPAVSCMCALLRGARRAIGSEEAASPGCLLHLVLVVRPIDTVAENLPQALVVSGAKKYLGDVVARLHDTYPDIQVTSDVVAQGDVAEALIGILEDEEEYSLLAMATHGRTGIMRWIWGSITERMVQKTQLPILLIRPH
jgi:nucleotide-binding universal stress UspA family protein